MTRIRVLSPVGVTSSDTLNVPPLPPSLAGRTVGFIEPRGVPAGPADLTARVTRGRSATGRAR